MAVEVLMLGGAAKQSLPMLKAIAEAARQSGETVRETEHYEGSGDWLVLYGYGAPQQARARAQHKGHVLMFDMGHVGDRNRYLRMTIDQEHPQKWLDKTEPKPERWERHGISLRSDYDERGPIILVGIGQKARTHLGVSGWEEAKFGELRRRFPGRRIVYRPKPRRRIDVQLDCETDNVTPIAELLKGVSLVVCRHSNVAVDAVIAGVPFEAEDGAATWLQGKPYTRETRLNFLRRLAWWQWTPEEAGECWEFARCASM